MAGHRRHLSSSSLAQYSSAVWIRPTPQHQSSSPVFSSAQGREQRWYDIFQSHFSGGLSPTAGQDKDRTDRRVELGASFHPEQKTEEFLKSRNSEKEVAGLWLAELWFVCKIRLKNCIPQPFIRSNVIIFFCICL